MRGSCLPVSMSPMNMKMRCPIGNENQARQADCTKAQKISALNVAENRIRRN